jgi:hypothetical protein
MASTGVLRTEEGLLLKLQIIILIIVIPDIVHRESILAWLRKDPRRLLAGMPFGSPMLSKQFLLNLPMSVR